VNGNLIDFSLEVNHRADINRNGLRRAPVGGNGSSANWVTSKAPLDTAASCSFCRKDYNYAVPDH